MTAGCRCGFLGCLIGLLTAISLLQARPNGPVGSAYLRTLDVRPAPFGELKQDVYPYEGVRMQRWRRDDPPADWLMVWIDLRTPALGYRVTDVHYRDGPAGRPIQAAYAQTTLDFVRTHGDPPRTDLAVNTVAYWPFPATNGKAVWLRATGQNRGP